MKVFKDGKYSTFGRRAYTTKTAPYALFFTLLRALASQLSLPKKAFGNNPSYSNATKNSPNLLSLGIKKRHFYFGENTAFLFSVDITLLMPEQPLHDFVEENFAI